MTIFSVSTKRGIKRVADLGSCGIPVRWLWKVITRLTILKFGLINEQIPTESREFKPVEILSSANPSHGDLVR